MSFTATGLCHYTTLTPTHYKNISQLFLHKVKPGLVLSNGAVEKEIATVIFSETW